MLHCPRRLQRQQRDPERIRHDHTGTCFALARQHICHKAVALGLFNVANACIDARRSIPHAAFGHVRKGVQKRLGRHGRAAQHTGDDVGGIGKGGIGRMVGCVRGNTALDARQFSRCSIVHLLRTLRDQARHATQASRAQQIMADRVSDPINGRIQHARVLEHHEEAAGRCQQRQQLPRLANDRLPRSHRLANLGAPLLHVRTHHCIPLVCRDAVARERCVHRDTGVGNRHRQVGSDSQVAQGGGGHGGVKRLQRGHQPPQPIPCTLQVGDCGF
mmetsp:Transcript_3912/g.12449  ORF Transcript_3912/g.12449 Transcript_3912/m.12449 type:complete len:274 (-) Transcript_3912:629-1450(-)